MTRYVSAIVGLMFAVLPASVPAAESGRVLERPADWGSVLVITVLVLLGLSVLGAIGYLYRRERGLDWDFQKPDSTDQH